MHLMGDMLIEVHRVSSMSCRGYGIFPGDQQNEDSRSLVLRAFPHFQFQNFRRGRRTDSGRDLWEFGFDGVDHSGSTTLRPFVIGPRFGKGTRHLDHSIPEVTSAHCRTDQLKRVKVGSIEEQ